MAIIQIGSIGQQKVCLSCLLILYMAVESMAYAKVLDCEVGDESKGYWLGISNEYGNCPYPGPPAEDSPWIPEDGSGVGYPFRLEGRYKVVVSMGAEGFALSPPPSRQGCIDGYAEAYTSWSAAQYQSYYSDSTGPWHITYTASSTLLSMVTTGPNYYHIQFVRYFDHAFLLYEWTCNQPPQEQPIVMQSFGPPPDTCPM